MHSIHNGKALLHMLPQCYNINIAYADGGHCFLCPSLVPHRLECKNTKLKSKCHYILPATPKSSAYTSLRPKIGHIKWNSLVSGTECIVEW